MMVAYYNEIDPYAAQWLRELIYAGLIAPGVVDERSIEDVVPAELDGFTQCHFFAGIGGWSLALREAGWNDDRAIWTGSCPCFPAGTLIFTMRGHIPIEEVKVNDFVLTHKGKWQPVIATGSEQSDIVIIKGQGHYGLACTLNHPFLIGYDKWAEAKDLIGERWRTLAFVPERNDTYMNNSLEFARFLGYWVGDGWVSNDKVYLCGNVSDGPFLKKLIDDAGLFCSLYVERTVTKARCSDKLLASFLTKHFGSGAKNKRIPIWLHESSKEFREAFLNGYAEADGHHEGNVRVWTTVSKSLAIGTRILLNQSGISASITSSLSRNSSSEIEGRIVNENIMYRVSAYENARSFRFDSQHGIGYVRKIIPSIKCKVFNLAVKEDESYYADGIAVHNCQPFSSANTVTTVKGFNDERHLWPAFFHLIKYGKQRTIPVIGEQVAFGNGFEWIDLVSNDLENNDYAVGVVNTNSCSFGAPHVRQRLYWVAHPYGSATFAQRWSLSETSAGNERFIGVSVSADDSIRRANNQNSFWGKPDYLYFMDKRWRPFESGTCPVVARVSRKLGRLRGYGNAINVTQARHFIETYMEIIDDKL